MSKQKDLLGALFFWDDGTATGYLTAGTDHYELVGVRRSDIRTDIEGRKVRASEPQQSDLFKDA